MIEDEKELPRISPEAMIAIWGTCIEIAECRVCEYSRVLMVKEQLRLECQNRFDCVLQEVSVQLQEPEEALTDLIAEVNAFVQRTHNPLNFFAQILSHYGKFKSHGLMNVSDHFSEVVTRWVEATLEINEKSGLSSERWFVNRALGNSPSGESIRFNAETQRFEDVPWSLKRQTRETLHEDAVKVVHPYSTELLNRLRMVANESNLDVRENRSFANPGTSNKEQWHRTMEVFDQTSNTSVITVWQRHKSFGQVRDFHFVEECPRDLMNPSIQGWINSSRILG